MDVDKLVPVHIDLSKLSDVGKNDVVKKDLYNRNAKVTNIEDKIPVITNLAINASLKVKGETPNITNLASTDALASVENRSNFCCS